VDSFDKIIHCAYVGIIGIGRNRMELNIIIWIKGHLDKGDPDTVQNVRIRNPAYEIESAPFVQECLMHALKLDF
jgi:hypothetical protein